LSCGAAAIGFSGDSSAADDYVEIIPFVSLSNDLRSGLKGLLFDGISNLASLIVVHSLKDRDRCQEIFIPITPVLGCVFHDVIECVAIQLPKSSVGFCYNSGGSRSIVKKSKLTEGITW